ncbi:MAG: stage III sporulation protein AF, partial [Clostridia bacterium]|nr:stage III sporulation protein AF [Clostridia bacterium]
MIDFLSSWVKGIGVTIVIVSILEMILPDNKTKKYVQMLLG